MMVTDTGKWLFGGWEETVSLWGVGIQDNFAVNEIFIWVAVTGIYAIVKPLEL